MKKSLYTLSSIFFIFFITPNIGLAQKAIGPKMVVEQTEYDAKEVRQGKIINHTFKVLNTGDQPLEIKSVKPG